MKKQGYLLIKNNEILLDENKYLKMANSNLETMVRRIEGKMLEMQDENRAVKHQFSKLIQSTRAHDSQLQSQIEELERIKRYPPLTSSTAEIATSKAHFEGENDQPNEAIRALAEENEKLNKMIEALQKQREEFAQTLSLVEAVQHSGCPTVDPFVSNRSNPIDSAILEKREKMLFPNLLETSQTPAINVFDSYRQSHRPTPQDGQPDVEQPHVVVHKRTVSLRPDSQRSAAPKNMKVQATPAYSCTLV